MDLWKINRDPFYGELFRQFGFDYIRDAGFFFDTDLVDRDIDKTLDLLCTPISFLKPMGKKPCVLLSTGAFSPIHPGHIQMMDSAKKEVERHGFTVIGGYLSPGHDEYIKLKTGKDWIDIHQRIAHINDAIRNISWLSVDPWEGIFNKVAINFTDVIDRLRKYLFRHLGQDIPIFYVCGGDNARFAMTFALDGYCVIVERPGYPHQGFTGWNPHDRIYSTPGGTDISSTAIRATSMNELRRKLPSKLRLRVGDDSTELKVLIELEKRFKCVEVQYIRSQREQFNHICQTNQVISLDTELSSGFSLEISRHYDLLGAKRLRYGNRPGVDLNKNLVTLENLKDCVLFDDDIHTGGTMRFAKDLLESRGIKVSAFTSLNIADPTNEEIADARDFLFGFHPNSGLVVELPNTLVRLPYLYPYVCPYLRTSIRDPLKFSIEMWNLNAELHSKTELKVSDCSYLQSFFSYMKYPSGMTLQQICLDHAAMLQSYL